MRNDPDMPRCITSTRAVVEVCLKVFGPALKGFDAPAGQPLRERVGEREAEIGPAQIHRRDGRADENRLETASHGLDLGQFGHPLSFRPMLINGAPPARQRRYGEACGGRYHHPRTLNQMAGARALTAMSVSP